jgi:hypothetical protein
MNANRVFVAGNLDASALRQQPRRSSFPMALPQRRSETIKCPCRVTFYCIRKPASRKRKF